MTAAEYLSGLSRKLMERGDGDIVDIIGVAAGLIDPEKELSRAQTAYIADHIIGMAADENDSVELGIGLAKLIREV